MFERVEIGTATLYHGDCREVLPLLREIDASVTDPPYEIGILGQAWDRTRIAYDVPVWRSVSAALKPGAHLLAFGASRTYHRMASAVEAAGFEIRDQMQWLYGTGFPKGQNLKPAHEPIVVARKAGDGAGLNIEACRVPPGRWPANVMHDGSDEVLETFPSDTAVAYSEKATRTPGKLFAMPSGVIKRYDMGGGSAARFFYCPKASKRDRGEGNSHPTVKPTELMEYLCQLITPSGGVVLDHCMGSGSTGVAAIRGGFRFIGIEVEPEYFAIARKRIEELFSEPERGR